MKVLRKLVRDVFKWQGFDIMRIQQDVTHKDPSRDPFKDMQHFLEGQHAPLILDVGANVGQSVELFRHAFPAACIHSFEPSPTTYDVLRSSCQGLPNVTPWNYAAGSQDTTMAFYENEASDMSSFLLPGEYCETRIVKTTDVEVVTLDTFARTHDIDFVHVLKSDTQGYDLEVFKGATRLMQQDRIGLIYVELIFSDMYQELPRVHEVLGYLADHNFQLVAFYDFQFQGGLASWTDALLINRAFHTRAVLPKGDGR